MNKDICKKIKKVYSKNLKKLFKNTLNNSEYILPLIVEFLKNLRDQYIVSEQLATEIDGTRQENLKIITIAAAIAEYEAYISCIDKYYIVEGNSISRINQNSSEEETLNKYTLEKNYHWACFWEYIKLNLESWIGGINDTI